MGNRFFFSVIFMCSVSLLVAQSRITGKVTDDSGEGMAGVLVRVVNSNLGTTTDFNGNFSFTVPPGEYKLEFSFTGFSSKTTDRVLSITNLQTAYIGFNVSKGEIMASYSNRNPKAGQPESFKLTVSNEEIEAFEKLVEARLIQERMFFSGLDFLPLKLPKDPTYTRIKAADLLPGIYRENIVTFDGIFNQLRSCIIDELKFKANVEPFGCGNGMAVIVGPQLIDIAGSIPNQNDVYYIDNSPIPRPRKWTWDDFFTHLLTSRKGYSRIMIFLFSNETPVFNQPGNISVSSNYNEILESRSFEMEAITNVNVPKWDMDCWVITYMFEHLDLDPDHPKLINVITTGEHLQKTGIAPHLTKPKPH